MSENLRERLRQLGVVRGVQELSAQAAPSRLAIEDLVPGRFRLTSRGKCFIAESVYPHDHRHGSLELSAFLRLSTKTAAQIAQDDLLATADLGRACFLDTETTGLSAGTGTMAFVVGVGFFSGDSFHVDQYFLRDPGDEPAMVEALAEQLVAFDVIVSYNGRSFDVPIIENRFILARVPPPTNGIPHLDLLHSARRLWRYHLPSCSLGTVEKEILGVVREQADVPGGVIPYLYRDYLRTGDAREMKRVLYHNLVDILSLVTLAAWLCHAFSEPRARDRMSGAELYGLGRWHASLGQPTQAEAAYRAALKTNLHSDLRSVVLRVLAYFLKRSNRRAQAFAYWQQLALEDTNDILAHVELAKYFEWHLSNQTAAIEWTETALNRVNAWPLGIRREQTLADLRHRVARLKRKAHRPVPNE